MKRTVWMLAALTLAGCGDVLAGTWTTSSLPEALNAIKPPGSTFEGTLAMSNGKNVTFTEVFTLASTGCVATQTYTGTYATSGGISITYTFTSGRETTTGCNGGTGDVPSAPTSPSDNTLAGGVLSGNYIATGNNLNTTGSYNGVPAQWSFSK